MADTFTANGSEQTARFMLDDWLVDAAANRLLRGDREIKLESKVMAVLVYLAQHKGELVTREQLEQAIWGGTIVGYDALTSCIAKLRKLLDDNPRAPRYIETISKKGYRLIARVSDAITDIQPAPDNGHATAAAHTATRTPVPAASIHRRIGLAVPGLFVIAIIVTLVFRFSGTVDDKDTTPRSLDRPSIVVLPFMHPGDDPDQSYFSDGMTADITTALSKLSGLFVISQSSATGYRGKPLDIKQVAKTLGVRYVLDGSIRRTHDRLRVNVNLIDANTSVYLWSEKYDRELKSVFDLQDEITGKIVNTLSIRLTQEEKRRTAHKYTASLAAYDDFLRGQAHYIRYTPDDNLAAREYFQQAIDRDSNFARAYSAMALTYVAEHRYGWSPRPAQHLDRALQLATKGVNLDNELPQAHWVLGYVHVFRKDYTGAANAASRALKLDPNFADSYLTLAVCRIHAGRPEEAVRLVRKAMLLNPQYPVAYGSVLGQAYFFMQQYDQAVPLLREAVNRNINLLTAHVFLIASLSKQDQMDEAVWAAEQLKTIAPGFRAGRLGEMIAYQNPGTIKDMQNDLRRAGL